MPIPCKHPLSVLALLLTLAAPGAHAATHVQHHGFVDEVQVLSDYENGNEYIYTIFYFTPVGSTTQIRWVIPLAKNGVDYSGAKYLQASLQQAVATGVKCYFDSYDTWGLGAHSEFSTFDIPRLRRLILYK